ncbi:hypothetical protein AGMMS49944_10510 [Spirochaetia bacterium]|nr:hypothetical protein AGMMS49944_10510 [Spirochaetia bacterium]
METLLQHAVFPPWVGGFYAKAGINGKKILVLGESHYCDDCEDCGSPNNKCNITQKIIEDYLAYKNGEKEFASWMNTFTRFTNVFFGKQCDDATIKHFWNSVVFYSYVQKSLHGPREAPSKEMFRDSETAFFEALNTFKPDIVFAWGGRLWNMLPDNGYWGKNYIIDEQGGKLYFYKIKTKDIPVYRVYHPSTSYFNYDCSKYLQRVMIEITQ